MRILKKSVLTLFVLAVAIWLAIYGAPLSNYAPLYYYGLVFAVVVYFAIISGGRWRNAWVVIASLVFGLGVIELISVMTDDRAFSVRQAGSYAPDSELGWIHGKPGVYENKKIDHSGKVIFDVTFTIDKNRNRKTISADSGPTVAFFGDSMTFGEGLPDDETLPQAFADLTDRKLRVLNLAVSGYGPEQFLRTLELDLHHDLLKQDPRLFVFLTAPWHAERTSCRAYLSVLNPSYQLVNGKPVYMGPCYRQLGIMISTIKNVLISTSTYRRFFKPGFQTVYPPDIDRYAAVLIRAGQLAQQRYGVRTLILYLTDWPEYFGQYGITDQMMMQRLRDGGLLVVPASIDQNAYPNQPLRIPGDGHPTVLANRIRAKMILKVLEDQEKK